MNKNEYLLIFALIIVGISTRFLFLVNGESILPNFTAIGAIALFGANYLKGKFRYIIPLIAIWISDLVLNNVVYAQYFEGYQLIGSIWVYAAFVLTILIGVLLFRNPSWTRLFVSCLGAGVVFYLITNFGVWLSPTAPYTKDLTGLINCYVAALPFFRNTLLGNVFYAFALFGVFEFIMVKGMHRRSERLLTKA